MPRRKKEEEREGPPPPPRGAANARERTRMRVLSKAFGRLKLTLPWVPPDTKLSKLDTLRLATSYISHLQKVLNEDEEDQKNQINLQCWPYGHSPQKSKIKEAEMDKAFYYEEHYYGSSFSDLTSYDVHHF